MTRLLLFLGFSLVAAPAFAQYGDAYHAPNTMELNRQQRAREQATSDAHYRSVYPSSSRSSSSYGGVSNEAAQQLADQWRRNAGRYTPEELQYSRQREQAQREEERQREAAAARRQQRLAEAERIEREYQEFKAAEKRKAQEQALARQAQAEADRQALAAQRVQAERKRQQDYADIASIYRAMGRASGLHPAEGLVYADRMNMFSTGSTLSETGRNRVYDAMTALRAMREQRATASYATLAGLLEAIAVLPLSTLRQATRLRLRFPAHQADIRKAELRAINYFYGADFGPYFQAQLPGGTATTDSLEMRWRRLYAEAPAEALAAMAAVPDARYNPLAQWSRRPSQPARLPYYTLLARVPAPDPDAWLAAVVPAEDWNNWRQTWPSGFLTSLLDQQPAMVLALLKRNKALTGSN